MDTYTPGPWIASDRFGNFGDHHRAEPDAPIGQVSRFSYSVRDAKGFIVAHCTNPLITMSAERSEVNARLIALAPTMFEMLQLISTRLELEERDHPRGVYLLAAYRQQITSLVKEARGER